MKPVAKPELFMLTLVQCAVYRHTTKALAQQLKAGGFLFLGIWLKRTTKGQAKQTKGVHELTRVETRTFHATSRPVCSV